MSSIASLFGPSAEEIVYARDQQERLRQQAQLQQSLAGQETQAARDFYQSGYNIAMGAGRGLAGLFGYSEQMTDPRIAKSLKLRQVLGNTGVEDLNDPRQLATLAQRFSEASMPEAALYFSDRKNALETQQRDYALELAKATAKGTMSANDLNQFMDQIGTDFGKNSREKLKAAEKGYAYYKQAKGLGPNSKKSKVAEANLDRMLITLSKDSNISLSEIQALAGGGSIGTRIADMYSKFFTGVSSAGKLDEKLRLVQILENIEADSYNSNAQRYRKIYKRHIDPIELDEALPIYSLSNYGQQYKNEKQGLIDQSLEIEITDEDINTFLGTP